MTATLVPPQVVAPAPVGPVAPATRAAAPRATARSLGPAVLLAAAVAGLSWASTFPVTALALPVLAPLLAVSVVDQLVVGRRAQALRPVLGLLAGAAVLVLILRAVDDAGLGAIADGLVDGWRRTLDSTLPARPDPDLVAFVPALALVAGVLGVEWGRRTAGPAAVLLPSLAVLGLGQMFHAASGRLALVVVTAYGLAAVAVLLAMRGAVRRPRSLAPQLVVTVGVAALVAGAAVAVGVPGRPTYSLQDGHLAPTHRVVAPDPLDQIASRLASGDRVAFTVRADSAVDRWPLVVLDRFDGVNWRSDARFRTLGTALPAPAVTAPVDPVTAEISRVELDGPWLPSQGRLRSADGIRPLVDPTTGVLVRDGGAPERYTLRWDDLQVDAQGLTSSAIDPQPIGAVAVDGIPAGIADLARQAVGPDAAPTVSAALVLEKWMQQNYQVATGDDLPTGHSTAQLLHFLNTSKRGTSEQFATAYALMARSLGIPVRVVVGFRDDGSGTVHDRDVLAWPEIAVTGLGWVPLDPTGGARSSTSSGDNLAAATEAARKELPSADQLATQQPGDPPPGAAPVPGRRAGLPLWLLAAVVLVAVAAVPTAKWVRRWFRRRAAPREAVVNAWRDTRDALADHGVPVARGSTVRDLASVAPGDAADAAADVEALARCVDAALWAGRDADAGLAGEAWAAAGRIRRGLRKLPWKTRLRAAFATGSLRRQPAQVAPRTG